MKTSTEARRPSQCSGCMKTYPWMVSELTQLFPLLCGHIFCRECLAHEARGVLSPKTQLPLQCCDKVVSSDYIRAVLEYEEHMYYAFLLNQARTVDLSANQKVDGGKSVLRSTGSAIETKQSAEDPVIIAPATMAAPITASGAAFSPIEPPQPRYLTRGSRARLVKEHASLSRIGTSPDQKGFCVICGIWSLSPLKAPCEHEVCLSCMEIGVRKCLDSAQHGNAIPFSCCDEILPLDLVRQVVSGRDYLMYAKLKAQYGKSEEAAASRGTKRKAAPRKEKSKAPAKKAKKASVIEIQDDSVECVACFSKDVELRIGPCGHGYCEPCLTQMAKTSLRNRDKVPIRCCSKEFPMEYVEHALSKPQFEKYKRFLAERDPSTSTLQSDLDYTAVVRKIKGKQCPTCGIGVVKISGCNTIHCSLGHYFCWLCVKASCICGRVNMNR